MRAMGIDIGTTTISVILMDSETGQLLGSKTISHKAFIEGKHSFHRVQDPERLYHITKEAVAELASKYGKPDSIGLTGQMHGVLYVNEDGMAVTPLYTWQDGSGNEKIHKEETYAQFLRSHIGVAATGYGMTTHFYLDYNDEIPGQARAMATISDYIAMRLCGRKTPVLAKDMAASWGCFDLKNAEFLKKKLEAAGICTDYLPKVCIDHEIIGNAIAEGIEGIPIMASLGDNQASFIGSVQNIEDTVLINIGTGSQVSFGTGNWYQTDGSIELRPCTRDSYLMAGSGLCGGRAYAMLEQFYQQVIQMTGQEIGETALYASMEKQARKFIQEKGIQGVWDICTTFSGTRTDPQQKGRIGQIGADNFTPGAMTAGMTLGILKELYEMYQQMCVFTGKKAVHLVGSGNGIRKNSLMQEFAEKMFGMKLHIPKCREEAAFGAALHSLVSAGLADSLEEVQKKIQYLP